MSWKFLLSFRGDNEVTPCINTLKKRNISYTIYKYKHDPKRKSYGLEAVEMLGLDENRVFKTLVIDADGQLVVAIVPVSSKLNFKIFAKAIGAKKVDMAEVSKVENSTGYILGGVSPIGQKKRFKTFIDSSAKRFETIYVSAGRRGLEVELKPDDLAEAVNGVFVGLC